MHCMNCGNATRFVLVVELSLHVRPPSAFSDPDWGFSLECDDCASTDVEGDPATLLAARAR